MLPCISPTTTETLIEWIDRGEAANFSSLSVGERVTWTNLDHLVLLAAAAARTQRVTIALQVTVLPMHPVALTAKRIASLDVVAGGRLRVGAGAGHREQDYGSAEAGMERRHARLAEVVGELRRLWSGEPQRPGWDPVGPQPIQPGGPPIWVGGSGPKALARAVEWADGYVGYTAGGDLVEMETTARMVAGIWEAAGAPPPPMVTSTFFCLGDNAAELLRERVGRYFGAGATPEMLDRVSTVSTPDSCLRALANAEAAGYSEISFVPVVDDPSQADRLAAALAL